MIYITKETSNQPPHILSTSIGYKFVKPNTLVASQTWLEKSEIIDEFNNWLNLNSNNKVVLISLYDPASWKFNDTEIDLSRVIHITANKLCFWLLAVDKFFLKYKTTEVIPTKITNNFLCYQRKVFDHRKLLFNKLNSKKGIITLGDRDWGYINENIPYHNGVIENTNVDTIPTPNDLYSLGNIDIWKCSFLNIVSETIQTPQDNVFLSEKTFKPIIGLRPFLHPFFPEISNLLEELGFKTFNDDFDYIPTNNYVDNISQIVNIVDKLNDIDLMVLYNKLIPKIMHNRTHLKIAVENEWKKFNKLVNEV